MPLPAAAPHAGTCHGRGHCTPNDGDCDAAAACAGTLSASLHSCRGQRRSSTTLLFLGGTPAPGGGADSRQDSGFAGNSEPLPGLPSILMAAPRPHDENERLLSLQVGFGVCVCVCGAAAPACTCICVMHACMHASCCMRTSRPTTRRGWAVVCGTRDAARGTCGAPCNTWHAARGTCATAPRTSAGRYSPARLPLAASARQGRANAAAKLHASRYCPVAPCLPPAADRPPPPRLQIILKCSDLGHLAAERSVHIKWVLVVALWGCCAWACKSIGVGGAMRVSQPRAPSVRLALCGGSSWVGLWTLRGNARRTPFTTSLDHAPVCACAGGSHGWRRNSSSRWVEGLRFQGVVLVCRQAARVVGVQQVEEESFPAGGSGLFWVGALVRTPS